MLSMLVVSVETDAYMIRSLGTLTTITFEDILLEYQPTKWLSENKQTNFSEASFAFVTIFLFQF